MRNVPSEVGPPGPTAQDSRAARPVARELLDAVFLAVVVFLAALERVVVFLAALFFAGALRVRRVVGPLARFSASS